MISVAGHTPSSKPPIVRVMTELLSGCFFCNGKIGFMGIGLQLVKKVVKKCFSCLLVLLEIKPMLPVMEVSFSEPSWLYITICYVRAWYKHSAQYDILPKPVSLEVTYYSGISFIKILTDQ